MGTIKSQKETSPLAHFVRNSLPHKSFRFCSPMRNIWNQQLEPANETSKWEPANRKRKLPLLLTLFAIHCLTKASAFVPQCKNIWSQQLETSKWEPVTGNQQMGTIKSQKETSPLAHFVRNSLPHKSFRFCSPMQKHMEPATGNHYLFVYLQCFGPSSLKRLFPPSPRISAHGASSIPCSDCK